MKVERYNLFVELFENINEPVCYATINYDKFNKSNTKNKSKASCYSNRLAPSYLNYSIDDSYNLLKINQLNKGYAIEVSDKLSSADEFVRLQFTKKSKATILRYVKRLEQCFDISYEHIFGEINKEKFNSIIILLKNMLASRFDQKNDTNELLANWETVSSNFFELINNNKASFYIIYSKNIPINICLLYHFENLIYCGSSGYNIDYQKFGLGHVAIYKEIELCIKNNYKVFEMGYGDLEYKKRWSNFTYNFEHHVIYNKNSVIATIQGQYEYVKVKIKEYIKLKKAQSKKSFVLKEKKKQLDPNLEKLKYELSFMPNIKNDTDLEKINLDDEKYEFLVQIVYDFLYSNIEHIDDVTVYKIATSSTSYLIQGKNKNQKIIFNNEH